MSYLRPSLQIFDDGLGVQRRGTDNRELPETSAVQGMSDVSLDSGALCNLHTARSLHDTSVIDAICSRYATVLGSPHDLCATLKYPSGGEIGRSDLHSGNDYFRRLSPRPRNDIVADLIDIACRVACGARSADDGKAQSPHRKTSNGSSRGSNRSHAENVESSLSGSATSYKDGHEARASNGCRSYARSPQSSHQLGRTASLFCSHFSDCVHTTLDSNETISQIRADERSQCNRARLRREACSSAKRDVDLKQGDVLLYRSSTDRISQVVTLVEVHHDDHPPYYTIRLPNGSEKQTIRDRLTLHTTDNYNVHDDQRQQDPSVSSASSQQALPHAEPRPSKSRCFRTPCQKTELKKQQGRDGTRAPKHGSMLGRLSPSGPLKCNAGRKCWSVDEPLEPQLPSSCQPALDHLRTVTADSDVTSADRMPEGDQPNTTQNMSRSTHDESLCTPVAAKSDMIYKTKVGLRHEYGVIQLPQGAQTFGEFSEPRLIAEATRSSSLPLSKRQCFDSERGMCIAPSPTVIPSTCLATTSTMVKSHARVAGLKNDHQCITVEAKTCNATDSPHQSQTHLRKEFASPSRLSLPLQVGTPKETRHSKPIRTSVHAGTRKRQRCLDGTRAPKHRAPSGSNVALSYQPRDASGGWWSLDPSASTLKSKPTIEEDQASLCTDKRTPHRSRSAELHADGESNSSEGGLRATSCEASNGVLRQTDCEETRLNPGDESKSSIPEVESAQKNKEQPQLVVQPKPLIQSVQILSKTSSIVKELRLTNESDTHPRGKSATGEPMQNAAQQPAPCLQTERVAGIIAGLVDKGRDRAQARQLLQTSAPTKDLGRDDLARLRVLSQVESKFIVAKLDSELLVLIDQHAASERVELERLQQAVLGDASDASSLEPSHVQGGSVALQITLEEMRWLSRHRGRCERWGFRYFFDQSTPESEVRADCSELAFKAPAVAVTHVPNILGTCLSPSDLKSLVADVEAGCKGPPTVVLHILSFKACRRAIKFGDTLTMIEMTRLLGHLSNCHFPFQCAHGRPTLYPLLNLQALKGALSAFNGSKADGSNSLAHRAPPLARLLKTYGKGADDSEQDACSSVAHCNSQSSDNSDAWLEV